MVGGRTSPVELPQFFGRDGEGRDRAIDLAEREGERLAGVVRDQLARPARSRAQSVGGCEQEFRRRWAGRSRITGKACDGAGDRPVEVGGGGHLQVRDQPAIPGPRDGLCVRPRRGRAGH